MFHVLKRTVSLSSFEYTLHMFWLRNKRNINLYTLLSGGLLQDGLPGIDFIVFVTMFITFVMTVPLQIT